MRSRVDTIDTKYTYNSLPYNRQDQDRDPKNNRQGLQPSYKYKQTKLLWLNSAFASANVSSGTTYYQFTWDVSPFQLFNRTKLKVVSYISNESNAKPIIMKLKDIDYDTTSTYNTDKEVFPTLYVNHTAVASQQPNNYFSLIVLPQQITRITITLSNDFAVRNAGFTISGGGAGHFILGLLFEEEDLIPDNAVSQYK